MRVQHHRPGAAAVPKIITGKLYELPSKALTPELRLANKLVDTESLQIMAVIPIFSKALIIQLVRLNIPNILPVIADDTGRAVPLLGVNVVLYGLGGLSLVGSFPFFLVAGVLKRAVVGGGVLLLQRAQGNWAVLGEYLILHSYTSVNCIRNPWGRSLPMSL